MSAITMVGPRFSIRGEQRGSISIEVYRYERPDTGDFWDSNWLECVVEVQVQGFDPTIGTSLRTDDFAKFLLELKEIAKPQAGEARDLGQWKARCRSSLTCADRAPAW